MTTRQQASLEEELVSSQVALAEQKQEIDELRAALASLTTTVTSRTSSTDALHQQNELANRVGGQIDRALTHTSLRPPPIEKFSGEREKLDRFLLAMDRRLEAAGQLATMSGFEFAVGHFTDLAASWFEYFTTIKPDVRSWTALRPHLAREFEMVNKERVYVDRLMECVQTGSVQDYVQEFQQLAVRCNELGDGYKQQRFAKGLCGYLRDKLITMGPFASLLEMQHAVLRLLTLCDPEKVQPDRFVAAVAAPAAAVVAAMPVRSSRPRRGSSEVLTGQHGSSEVLTCYNCKKKGHTSRWCPERGSKPAGPAVRGSARMGRYNGSGRASGRVNAIEVAESEELSDSELRQGNEQA